MYKNNKEIQNRLSKLWTEYAKVYPYLEYNHAYKVLLKSIIKLSNIKDSGEKQKALDLGAGTGNVTKALLEKYPNLNIISMDNSAQMLSHLKDKLEKYSDRVIFELQDISNDKMWEVFDSQFDLVISNLVLTYVYNPENKNGEETLMKIFKNIYSILKNGGEFIWSTPINNVNFIHIFISAIYRLDFIKVPNISPLKGIFYAKEILRYSKEIEKLGKEGIFSFFDTDKIIEIMKESGFENIHIEKSFEKQVNIVYAKK